MSAPQLHDINTRVLVEVGERDGFLPGAVAGYGFMPSDGYGLPGVQPVALVRLDEGFYFETGGKRRTGFLSILAVHPDNLVVPERRTDVPTCQCRCVCPSDALAPAATTCGDCLVGHHFRPR